MRPAWWSRPSAISSTITGSPADSPILSGAIGESAGGGFRTEYDLGKAYLAQTGQLSRRPRPPWQSLLPESTFRAEKSDSTTCRVLDGGAGSGVVRPNDNMRLRSRSSPTSWSVASSAAEGSGMRAGHDEAGEHPAAVPPHFYTDAIAGSGFGKRGRVGTRPGCG
jgi:hypothetical protein